MIKSLPYALQIYGIWSRDQSDLYLHTHQKIFYLLIIDLPLTLLEWRHVWNHNRQKNNRIFNLHFQLDSVKLISKIFLYRSRKLNELQKLIYIKFGLKLQMHFDFCLKLINHNKAYASACLYMYVWMTCYTFDHVSYSALNQ